MEYWGKIADVPPQSFDMAVRIAKSVQAVNII